MVISNIRQSLLQDNPASKIQCSLYMPLTDGNMTIYDYDNNTTFNPNYYKYLSSNEDGTTFNKTKGHGIYFTNNAKDIKSFSLELRLNSISGSLSNSWGGIGYLYNNTLAVCYGVFDRHNDNKYSYTGLNNNGYAVDLNVTINHTRNQWHKICINTTFDRSKSNSSALYSVSMYIDGLYAGMYSNYGHYGISGSSFYFIIGNSWRLYNHGPNSTDINPLCGTIKNIRMFRRTLTSEEALVETI